MARKADKNKLAQLKDAIAAQPGKTPSSLAKMLGWHRQEISRALMTSQDARVLFWEDERGGLHPFDPDATSQD